MHYLLALSDQSLVLRAYVNMSALFRAEDVPVSDPSEVPSPAGEHIKPC